MSPGLKRPQKRRKGKRSSRKKKNPPKLHSMETRQQRFLLMGGGCFLAFPAASVASLNAAEGNFWVMSRHRGFAGQLCWLFVLWQPKSISHPVWLLCPPARVTVLMPEWQTGTCAHAEVFLGQSSASEFQTACIQQIIATAGGGHWVPGPLMPQPPSLHLGLKNALQRIRRVVNTANFPRGLHARGYFFSLIFP